MKKTRLRASTVCSAEGNLLVVRLRDPVSGVEGMYPPGGAVEAGETPSAAAIRETLEETGLHVRVVESTERVERYPFRWAGEDVDVTTHFFFAELDEPFAATIDPVKDATYNLGASWMPVSDALEAMPAPVAAHVATVLRAQNHAAWRAHANIGGPAGTLLGIHDQFRAASRRLLAFAAEATPADLPHLRRAFAPLAETLHHHHHAEEAMLFPAIGAPARLAEDHETLTQAIDALASSFALDVARMREAATRFDHVLVTHLDREEGHVVPLLLSMRPHEAWSLIHG